MYVHIPNVKFLTCDFFCWNFELDLLLLHLKVKIKFSLLWFILLNFRIEPIAFTPQMWNFTQLWFLQVDAFTPRIVKYSTTVIYSVWICWNFHTNSVKSVEAVNWTSCFHTRSAKIVGCDFLHEVART